MSSFLLVTNNPPDKVIAVTRFTIVKPPLKPAKKPCKKTVQWPVRNGRQTFPKIRKA